MMDGDGEVIWDGMDMVVIKNRMLMRVINLPLDTDGEAIMLMLQERKKESKPLQ